MFMGERAFCYYYPVLFRYLMNIEPVDHWDDCESWIIGCGLENQYKALNRLDERQAIIDISKLIPPVLLRIEDWPIAAEEKTRTLAKWRKVASLYTP